MRNECKIPFVQEYSARYLYSANIEFYRVYFFEGESSNSSRIEDDEADFVLSMVTA